MCLDVDAGGLQPDGGQKGENAATFLVLRSEGLIREFRFLRAEDAVGAE